jgi:hypothetical protein
MRRKPSHHRNIRIRSPAAAIAQRVAFIKDVATLPPQLQMQKQNYVTHHRDHPTISAATATMMEMLMLMTSHDDYKRRHKNYVMKSAKWNHQWVLEEYNNNLQTTMTATTTTATAAITIPTPTTNDSLAKTNH